MKKGFMLIIISFFLVFFVKTTIACSWGMMGSMMGGSTQAPKAQNMGMPMGMCSPMMGSMTAMGDRTSQEKGEEKSQKSDQEKEIPEDSMEKRSQTP